MLLGVIDRVHYTLLIDIAAALSLFVALLFVVISYPITVQKEKISLKLIPVFLKNRFFMAICFFLFFQSAFEALVNNWAVSFFMSDSAISRENALFALSFSVLGMIVMRVLIGTAMKKTPYQRLVTLALTFLTLGLICLMLPVPYFVKVA